MNNIYFPANVALFLRRMVNVFGTLSISNQYLLLKQAKVDDGGPGGARSRDRWPVLKRLRAVEWPRWRDLKESRDGILLSSTIGIPWLTRERNWAWSSLIPLPASGLEPGGHDSAETHRRHTSPRQPTHRPPHHRRHPPSAQDESPPDTIHQLLLNPTLYNPLRAPRYPLVLCHGLYGFDVRGPSSFPSLRVHYWSNVLNILRDKVGAEVIVTSVPGTGSISSRAETLNKQLEVKARGRGINFLAHSMGGLDCRHLITHIKPEEYTPLSLTTVSTPHRGSPFMDWCAEYIGIGKLRKAEQEAAAAHAALSDSSSPIPTLSSSFDTARSGPSLGSFAASSSTFSLSLSSLPSSFTTLLLSVVDSPAYANLTTTYLNTVFNPSTPNDPRVKYFSVASRLDSVSVWHPFWLPKMVCDGVEERERGRLRGIWESEMEDVGQHADPPLPLWAQGREWGNDGLVTVQSAKWGDFLGIMEGCDHWEMRGARGLELDLAGIASEGWSVKDWGRFIGAWKREEKLHRDALRDAESTQPSAPKAPTPPSPDPELKQSRDRVRGPEREHDDDVIKASTDRLSAVFDWIVDQVPTPPILGGKEKMKEDVHYELQEGPARSRASAEDGATKGKRKRKNELEKKEDLERFYVALSRKLYDEGL